MIETENLSTEMQGLLAHSIETENLSTGMQGLLDHSIETENLSIEIQGLLDHSIETENLLIGMQGLLVLMMINLKVLEVDLSLTDSIVLEPHVVVMVKMIEEKETNRFYLLDTITPLDSKRCLFF